MRMCNSEKQYIIIYNRVISLYDKLSYNLKDWTSPSVYQLPTGIYPNENARRLLKS